MLKKRIIPCLDVKDGRVVKGVNFVNLTDVGDPVDSARAYYEAGCDELVFLDITATSDNRETTVDMVRRVADQIEMPHDVEVIEAEDAARPHFEIERSIRGTRTHQQRHLRHVRRR